MVRLQLLVTLKQRLVQRKKGATLRVLERQVYLHDLAKSPSARKIQRSPALFSRSLLQQSRRRMFQQNQIHQDLQRGP